MKDLVELDELELKLRDRDGHIIALPKQDRVSIPKLLEDIKRKQAEGVPEPTISIYLNQGVQVPFNATMHFKAIVHFKDTATNDMATNDMATDEPKPMDCTIAEGETTNVQVSESGQTFDVQLPFFPKLTLNQRSEAPPRPGKLGFTVALEPSPGGGEGQKRKLCPSKTQTNAYYVPKSSQVTVTVDTQVDTFTVFDGWDDQDCPDEGECALERSQPIDTDTTWTAKFASWNCLQPDAFCKLEPEKKRHKTPIADMSAMSGWVDPNGHVWIVGHRGTTQTVGPGIIIRWTGTGWIQEAAGIPTEGKRFWDIAGDSSMTNIVAVGDQIILHKSAGVWRDAGIHVWATGVWVGNKDGAWVTAKNAPAIVHNSLTTGGNWSLIDHQEIRNLSSSLHSISGNDDDVIVATGAKGTILKIEKKRTGELTLKKILVEYANSSIYSSNWRSETGEFILASNDAIFRVSSQFTAAQPYVTGYMGSVFGNWLPPIQPKDKLECWTTGSYGTTRRWVLDPRMDPLDPLTPEDLIIPGSTKISLRSLIGPDVNHLWAIGYQRERSDGDKEIFEIKLFRYCPEDKCKPALRNQAKHAPVTFSDKDHNPEADL
jgi:hypothetical protein